MKIAPWSKPNQYNTHTINCTRKADQTVEEVETLLAKTKPMKIISHQIKYCSSSPPFLFL